MGHGRRSAIKFLLRKKLIRKAKRNIKKKGLMHAHKWYNNAKRSASKFIKKKLKRKGPMIKSSWYKHAKRSASKFIKKKLKRRKLGWWKRARWRMRAVKKVTKFLRYRKMRLGPRDFKKLRKLRKQLIRRYRKIKKSNPRYARSWYKHGRRSAIKFLLRKKLIRKFKRKIKKKGLKHAHKWYKHAKWSARKFIKKKLKLRELELAEEDSKDPSLIG